MWKLIFLGLIIWLAVYIVKRTIGPAAKHLEHTDTAEGGKEPIENMVQCTTCHVHLPRSEAFLVNGNFYCSQAHIEHK